MAKTGNVKISPAPKPGEPDSYSLSQLLIISKQPKASWPRLNIADQITISQMIKASKPSRKKVEKKKT